MKLKLRNIFPKTLFARFVIILVLPSVFAQVFMVYFFYERHWANVSHHMLKNLVGEVNFISHIAEVEDRKLRNYLFNTVNGNLYLKTYFVQDGKIDYQVKNKPLFAKDLQRALSYTIKDKYYVYINKNEDIVIQINKPLGLLNIVASKKRLISPSTYIYLLWVIGSTIILLIVSLLFMKNQLRPIKRLSVIADKFGRGVNIENMRPSGAKEVRTLALAFIKMRHRLDRQVKYRMEMLAGVSHDLRTPLTRIKLQIALMDQSDELNNIQNDVKQMEAMLNEFLDFARAKNSFKIDESVVINELIENIIETYKGQKISIKLKMEDNLSLYLNTSAFSRVIVNIIDNALRYANNLEISAVSSDKYVVISFDDDGPGIEPAKRDLVMRPFYRIDISRNNKTGGVGLGLSITKDIVVGYGGKIALEESHLGGLKVKIILPKTVG